MCVDVQKEVTFPFNVETDTAHSVATEMAHEFNLTCGVEWLTNELQKRGLEHPLRMG